MSAKVVDVVAVIVSITSLMVAVAALYFAIRVPIDVDEQAWERQQRKECLDSVISLRGANSELAEKMSALGFEGSTAGWEAVQLQIDRARVLCNGHLSTDLTAKGEVVWQLFVTAREDASGLNGQTSSDIQDWTRQAILELSSR